MDLHRVALGFAAVAGLGFGGCAIHPLPDDVAHVSTYEIVRQVRCETRQAVIDSMLRYLTSDYNLRENKLDRHSYDIGHQLKADSAADPDAITKFDPGRLTGFARTVVGLLYHTGVAYNYDLLGVETTNFDPTINFIRPLPITSLVSLGVGGNFDRQRQNERSFTITDTFGGLLANVHADYCTHSVVEANYVYPITGRVGVDRVVRDFMLLTLFGNLGGLGKSPKDIAIQGPPSMVDQLQFQTTISGTASPKIVFNPTGRAFQVSDASLTLSASRKDTHQVTIGLFLDKTGAEGIGGVRDVIFRGGLLTASGGRAAQGAAQAVEQFLQQKIFKPTIVITQ